MKKQRHKLFMSWLLTLVIVLAILPTAVFAKAEPEISVDEDMAKALATLFVSRNFGVLDGWSDDTRIKEVIPLYGNDDGIKAYCVKLQNGSVQAGYVTVSTNLKETLIQEYSDQALPVFETETSPDEEENIQYIMEMDGVQKIYYYGPLRYASQKQNNDEMIIAYSNEEIVDHYEENIALLTSLLPFSKQISTLEQKGNIENPYDYLVEIKPGDSYRVYSGSPRLDFDGYIIRDHNGCAVYATAAVITYHLKPLDGIDFDTRVEQCKAVSVSEGYGKVDNYYLAVGSYKPYINKCLALYNTTLTADSDLFFPWNSACKQINAGCPVLINIAEEPGSGYHDHTVVAYGWITYLNNAGSEYRFYHVRDGYDATANRYVDVERIGIYYITKIS